MNFAIEAACGCNIGRVRKNNEDNFFFDNKSLELVNQGLPTPLFFSGIVKRGLCFAVFDGMGGENYGEVAAYTAATHLQKTKRTLLDYFISLKEYLNKLTLQLNEAIIDTQKVFCTDRCGSTMAALYFSSNSVYVCNIGDSRAYRLRGSKFLQLSTDHVENYPSHKKKKSPLTQHLGIDPNTMQIEPSIVNSKLHRGDKFLLCSDGLTDMLTDLEISAIMSGHQNVNDCVNALICSALEHGGHDNITVIVCNLK